MIARPPGPYPHVYRPWRWMRWVAIGLAVLALPALFWLAMHMLLLTGRIEPTTRLEAAAMCLLLAALIACLVADCLVARVVLDEDRIEIVRLFDVIRIPYARIRGKVRYPEGEWRIEHTQPPGRLAIISGGARYDDVFKAWLAALPEHRSSGFGRM